MTKILRAAIIPAFFLIPFLCSAQTGQKGGATPVKADTAKVKTAPASSNNDVTDEFADEEPYFPGDYNRFIAENLYYPVEAALNDIQGNVKASFVVEKNGSLSNIKIIDSLSAECNAEVIRLLKAMPPWTPGKIGGKPVRVRQHITIKFTLSGPTKKKKRKRGRD